MTAAAIKATYCGFRTIAGRKQLQMTFEVPIEKSAEVLTALGAPDSMNPAWVAIALLDPKVLQEEQAPEARSSSSPNRKDDLPPADAGLDKERTPWRDVPLAKQAGMRCGEIAFWRFLEAELDFVKGRISDKDTAADFLRRLLGVASRSELGNPTDARAKAWVALNDRYEAWLRS